MSAASPHTLFVTGGRGRLAALIADHFAAPRHRVELFSRATGPGFHSLAALTQPAALAGANALLHLAWSTLPASSEQQPAGAEQADLALVAQLLDALAATPAAQRPLFVFFSSGGAVYGNAPARPSREDDAPAPIGRYGRSKLAAERLIAERAARDGLACCILRISNPYGYPVPRNRAQGLIPHALRCAADGETLALWGDGSARKDFLYYTDFLAALSVVLERRLAGTFNLAAGESHSVNEVLDLVAAEIGRPPRIERGAAPGWDVQDSRVDPARLVAATGWRPQVSLAEGIRRTAGAYRTS